MAKIFKVLAANSKTPLEFKSPQHYVCKIYKRILWKIHLVKGGKDFFLLFCLPLGCGGGLSRSNSPGLRVFCDASHLYHKKHFVRNSLCELRHPQPMDISLRCVEHGNLPKARAAWCMSESRTQNFRGISECTTKIQAQDYE